jgi:hypothetical protein
MKIVETVFHEVWVWCFHHIGSSVGGVEQQLPVSIF